MGFLLEIWKGDTGVGAWLSDEKAERGEEFDIENVIGDYYAIRKREKARKTGRWITNYDDLDTHVFGGLFGERNFPYDYSWIELRYETIKKSFLFLERAKKLLDSKAPLIKKRQELWTLSRQYDSKAFESIKAQENECINSYNELVVNPELLKERNARYEYTCGSQLDMILAIMDFYLLNDYKLIRCHHCCRYFAAQTRKRKYCKRISRYENQFSQKESKPYPCEETVRREMQFLREKKDRILRRIANNTQLQETEVQFEAQRQCAARVKLAKQNPTPREFKSFNKYLDGLDKKTQKKGERK